jgi:tetratricopeptide (TPR) repeat protein/antitoxin component of RelBE/YafQ-DinJ toxin-antitoxin module
VHAQNNPGNGPAGGIRPTRKFPSETYYNSKPFLFNGDYDDAATGYRRAMRQGLKIGNVGWIDYVCYHAMIGECLYQTGEFHNALAQYNLAIETLLRYPRFLTMLGTPTSINKQVTVNRPTWGPRTRRALLSGLDRHLQAGVRTVGFTTLPGGGQGVNLDQRQIYMLDAGEVTRCAALSLFRRRELMGAACAKHPYTQTILATLSPATNVLPNHWTQAWYKCILGMALANGNDDSSAISTLQQSLLIEGRFDHPATSIALIGIGQLFMEKRAHKQAATAFLEATFPAVEYRQYMTVSDAFHRATMNHIAQQTGLPFDPVVAATVWVRRISRSDHLKTSLILDAADATMEVTGPQTLPTMRDWIKQANSLMRRSPMLVGLLGQRSLYHETRILMRQGKLREGSEAFARLMTHKRKSSLWLYQISLVDEMFAQGSVGQRTAFDLYERVLRVPNSDDWLLQPTESLSVLLSPNFGSLERWFEIAMAREKFERAMMIADEIRRRRFFESLPLGGRLLGLRWILGASTAALGRNGIAERQSLVARFPFLGKWQIDEGEVRRALNAGVLFPTNDEATRQHELLEQLVALGASGEAALRKISFERVPASLVFPPPADIDAIKRGLGQRHLVMSFFATSRAVYGFALDGGTYAAWRIASPGKLRAEIGLLLREIGNYGKNNEIGEKALRSNWREPAASLFAKLTNNASGIEWSKYDELVIVPDGILWYLPFEMLPTSVDDELPLLAHVKIRYAPTLSLAVPSTRPLRNHGETLLVVDALFPGDEEASAERADRLLNAVENSFLAEQLPVPSSVFGVLVDRAVIYADLDARGTSLPYRWSPFKIDEKTGLGDWMALPWGAPEQLVLPGFHTNAESALKAPMNGNEIFLTVCGLMASGSRSILLSRWRVGGNSTEQLISEYVQELPYRSAPAAWQRSVELFRSTELDPMSEPRIQRGAWKHALNADHPFFWSGYMLVDDGGKMTK